MYRIYTLILNLLLVIFHKTVNKLSNFQKKIKKIKKKINKEIVIQTHCIHFKNCTYHITYVFVTTLKRLRNAVLKNILKTIKTVKT